ncbi:hypothetical protein L6R29_24750 [Myxococcota bacterium]|nr:hypothetical protein [Myxococcota bacterium]
MISLRRFGLFLRYFNLSPRHFGLFCSLCLFSFHVPLASAQTTRPSSLRNLSYIRVPRPSSLRNLSYIRVPRPSSLRNLSYIRAPRSSSLQNPHNIPTTPPPAPHVRLSTAQFTAVCCVLRCAAKNGYTDTSENKAPHRKTIQNNKARSGEVNQKPPCSRPLKRQNRRFEKPLLSSPTRGQGGRDPLRGVGPRPTNTTNPHPSDKTKLKNKKIACLLAAFTRIQHCRRDLAILEKNMRKKLDDEETACKTSCATSEPCFSACTNIFSTRTANFEQTLRTLRPLCETLPAQAALCFSPAIPSPQTNAFSTCLARCDVPN